MRLMVSLPVLMAALSLSACVTEPRTPINPSSFALPTYAQRTASQQALFDLPPPTRPVAVAVYGFTDQTGKFEPSDTGQTLSRAVTQGGTSILLKALQDAGQRQWFTIVEREQVSHLLNERQIIREMRERYLGEKGVNPEALPSLLFAGVILEGGIVGYDSNVRTGGSGAGFLGISVHDEYRQDMVTVYLRAVSVRTGEVLSSVTASKTISSFALGGGVYRYVAYKQYLETETGTTTNEPANMAMQQAIEKAVYALIMEGAEQKLWEFQDKTAAWPYTWAYQNERDGTFTAEQVEAANKRARKQKAALTSQQKAVGQDRLRADSPPPMSEPEAQPAQPEARLQGRLKAVGPGK
ncbi:CsgG/HfaB family protein [Asticcacaulis taihuensis]|uniref:Curli production assembly/transport component CsgG n=1 Tax=Asticcacaulis taihuensis TaxID=260084 RepID=A0A1G4SK87_9CAUL|nr:CsgG/HfaB family protein [Asticcacaulis taihuensis]SCW68935.1 curli production assembly/transport component CsgG [Asticcacaulis taihuensis]